MLSRSRITPTPKPIERILSVKEPLFIASVLTFFSTPAFAQSAGGGFDLLGLLPLVLIGTIIFFIVRTARKRTKIKEKNEKVILDGIESRLKNLENNKDSI
jgi:hypothetical protein